MQSNVEENSNENQTRNIQLKIKRRNTKNTIIINEPINFSKTLKDFVKNSKETEKFGRISLKRVQ